MRNAMTFLAALVVAALPLVSVDADRFELR
jgi:hypothetical protein